MRRLFASALVVISVASAASSVLAEKGKRSPEDCAAAWGKATRSYGKAKKDDKELVADKEFAAACELEGKGDKAGARAEAVRVAVIALTKEDGDGCVRFLTSYIGAKEPQATCDLATGDEAALKKSIAENLPAPPAPKSKSK